MAITVETIKALRDITGAGIMDSKRALEQADGDLDKAQVLLRETGLSAVAKKAERVTNEGLVESYIHSGGRIGAIVEANCETDFVARTPEFRGMAHDVAMQVAAMAPIYLDKADVPEGEEIDSSQLLLQQAFIKDESLTVQDVINEVVAKVGENIRIRRFARFSLGE